MGGILTKKGLGTICADGKRIVEVNGEEFLLETPLKADVSILASRSADYGGNLVYSLTARNFNPLMALAADLPPSEWSIFYIRSDYEGGMGWLLFDDAD